MGYNDLDGLGAFTATKRKKVNPAKESAKIGIFALGVALLVWIDKKFNKGWSGILFFRGKK